MSAAAKPTNSSSPSSGNAPTGKISNIDMVGMLENMKLGTKNNADLFVSLNAWVDAEPKRSAVTPQSFAQAKADACRQVSTLLIIRLLRAFEKRSDPNEGKKRRSSNPSSPDGKPGRVGASSGSPNNKAAGPRPGEGGRTANDNSTTGNNKNSDISPDQRKQQQTSHGTASTSAGTSTGSAGPSTGKKLPSLDDMMTKQVKVTLRVMGAFQFVGSDILKLLQIIPSAPTIADVATCSLKILGDIQSITECYQRFVIANTGSGKDPNSFTFDAKIPSYFGVFALQSLQALRAQAISAYELAYDYDFIFDSTYSSIPSFRTNIDALNVPLPVQPGSATPPIFLPDTEARNVSWKLARFLTVRHDFTVSSSSSNEESNQRPEGRKRRQHIIRSVAAIVFTAELGQMAKLLSTPSTATSDAGTPQDVVFATTQLMSFLEANTDEKDEFARPISRQEIESMVSNIKKMMLDLPSHPKDSPWHQIDPAVPFWKLPRVVQEFVKQTYPRVVTDLVSSLNQSLCFGPSPPKDRPSRTPISRCLFLFPMVLGEPWGFHRDAPTITSRQLCTATTKKLDPALEGSMALVLKKKSIMGTPKKRQSSLIPPGVEPLAKRPSRNPVRIGNQPPAKPRPAKVVKMSEVDPPVVNEAMELNEWTLSILSLSVIKPSDTLLTFLGEHDRRRGDSLTCLHEVIVPVLNRGISRINKSLRLAQSGGASQGGGQIFVGKRDGKVYVNGAVNEDIQLCASVIGFFYHSLEAIMNDQLKRLEFLGPFNALMQSESFHRALLAICYACILKGVGATQRLQIDGSRKDSTVFMLLETIECNPYTFLKVLEALRRALVVTEDEQRRMSASPLIPGLPGMLHQYVQKIEVQLLESIIWAQSMPSTKSESTLTVTIKSMKSLPGSWPPDILAPVLPEEIMDASIEPTKLNEVRFKPTFSASSEANFLTYVLRKLLKLAFHRIQAIFSALNLSSDTVVVQSQVYVAFRYCMRHHIDLLFDRHVDQLLLCTIYAICKVMNVKPAGSHHVVSFGQILDAYCSVRGPEQGQRTCRVIVRHVKLASSDDEVRPRGQFFGAIIDFYNQVYVPKMQRHFLRSKSLKKSALEYYNSSRVLKEQRQLQTQNGTSRLGTRSRVIHASGEKTPGTGAVRTESGIGLAVGNAVGQGTAPTRVGAQNRSFSSFGNGPK